jgi:hypothetical protein
MPYLLWAHDRSPCRDCTILIGFFSVHEALDFHIALVTVLWFLLYTGNHGCDIFNDHAPRGFKKRHSRVDMSFSLLTSSCVLVTQEVANEDSTFRLEPAVAIIVYRRPSLGNIIRIECPRSRKERQPLRCDL